MSKKIIKAQDVKMVDAVLRDASKSIKADSNKGKTDSLENREIIKDKIKRLRKEAEERAKVFADTAYKKGFSKGIEEGMHRSKKELASTFGSIGKMINNLKVLEKETLENLEKEIITLSFAIAEKVIHKEVSINSDVVLAVLRNALKNVPGNENIKIKLNPKDYNYINEIKPDVVYDSSDMGKVHLEKDSDVGVGGAIIEMPLGEIDARLDKQLHIIKESFQIV